MKAFEVRVPDSMFDELEKLEDLAEDAGDELYDLSTPKEILEREKIHEIKWEQERARRIQEIQEIEAKFGSMGAYQYL